MGMLRFTWAVVLTLMFAAPVQAGWVIVDKDGDTTLVSNGRMRSISEGGGVIFDGKRSRMVFLADDQRMYAEGSVAEFCTAVSSVYDAVLANVPPEQRAMMEQMGGGKKRTSPPKVSVKRAGPGGSIAGYETDTYQVHVDGKLYEEVWIATDKGLAEEMRNILPLIKEFGKCQGGPGMSMENEPESTPAYQEMMAKGWELKSVSHEQGVVESSSEVVRVEKKDIPDSDFTPPAGYRKASFGELMGAQMQME